MGFSWFCGPFIYQSVLREILTWTVDNNNLVLVSVVGFLLTKLYLMAKLRTNDYMYVSCHKRVFLPKVPRFGQIPSNSLRPNRPFGKCAPSFAVESEIRSTDKAESNVVRFIMSAGRPQDYRWTASDLHAYHDHTLSITVRFWRSDFGVTLWSNH